MTPLDQALLVAGLLVSGLCLAFFFRTFVELRRIDAAAEGRSAAAGARSPERSTHEKEHP